jgi:hypothetical protein
VTSFVYKYVSPLTNSDSILQYFLNKYKVDKLARGQNEIEEVKEDEKPREEQKVAGADEVIALPAPASSSNGLVESSLEEQLREQGVDEEQIKYLKTVMAVEGTDTTKTDVPEVVTEKKPRSKSDDQSNSKDFKDIADRLAKSAFKVDKTISLECL